MNLRYAVFAVVVSLPALAGAQAALPPADEVAQHAADLAAKVVKKEPAALSVAAELAGSLTTGNTNTRNLNASLNLAWAFAADWLSTTRGQGIFSRADITLPGPPPSKTNQETAMAWMLSERVDRYLSDRFGLFGATAYERNPFAGLGRRLSGQLGATFLIHTRMDEETPDLIADRLNLDAGFYGADEYHVPPPYSIVPLPAGEKYDTILAARGALSYVHRFAKGKELGADVEVIEDFVDTANTVAQGSAFVSTAFTQVLSLKITATYRYDNVVPEGTTNEDFLLTAGLLVNL